VGFLLSTAAILPLLLSTASSSFAGSATWKASPATGDWNTTSNWSPATVPNGFTDTATFASSNKTGVSLSAYTQVIGIEFNSGASAFTITVASVQLTISGEITNNSGITQNFVAGAGKSGYILFSGGAAGSLTMFTNNGGTVRFAGSSTEFVSGSTAGNGTFTNNGGAVSGAAGGVTGFGGTSTAGSGTFTNNGSTVSGAGGGSTYFSSNSTAGNGTFTNNGGAVSGEGGGTSFFDISTAGDATLIATGDESSNRGGSILFYRNSRGNRARVQLSGNGNLDISPHNTPGMAIGSIEGSGVVFLGANNLTVGKNNLDTTFSGLIRDGGGSGGIGGSLTKVGTGTLVLTHSNTYTGGTTIAGGKLVVNTKSGSGTGGGAVQVNGGRLGGTGTIAGDVTVGDGSGRGAVLSPGYQHGKNPGTLTIQSTLTFNPDATYKVQFNSTTATADEVVALGVTINSGAQFSFADLGGSALTPGTVFTVIDNIAASPIAGTFSNLANGATFTSNGNNFQASYTGGTGNDLTLTVVP
jgi:autotransporter-associated beta strand protein